jgi:hypothetical protein
MVARMARVIFYGKDFRLERLFSALLAGETQIFQFAENLGLAFR